MPQNSFMHLWQCLGDIRCQHLCSLTFLHVLHRQLLSSFNQETVGEQKDFREEGLWIASDILQSLLSTASKPVFKDKHMLQASLPYTRFNPISLSICL